MLLATQKSGKFAVIMLDATETTIESVGERRKHTECESVNSMERLKHFTKASPRRSSAISILTPNTDFPSV